MNAPVTIEKRNALTRTQLILLCQRQSAAPILCGCGCGEPLEPVAEGIIDEHVLPRTLTERGRESERDALENRALLRKPCAMAKTKADLAVIAKARAQGGETGQRARRERRGEGLIPGRADGGWPPKGSRKLASKPFAKKADKGSLGTKGAARSEPPKSPWRAGE